MEWGLQRLQSLKRLGFINCDPHCWDVESFPEEYLLPTTVTHLYITGFGNLRKLNNTAFQHLTSLQYLSMEKCPKLKHMPEEGLPVTISNIKIITCPLLKKRLQRKKGKEWRNIAHIPFIEIIERNTSNKANQVFVLLAPLLILLAFFLIYLLACFFPYKLSIKRFLWLLLILCLIRFFTMLGSWSCPSMVNREEHFSLDFCEEAAKSMTGFMHSYLFQRTS